MPSIITRKFEQWAATQQAANLPARPDAVIFAYVPGQSDTADVNRDEGMPAAENIMHTTPVLQYGMLNTDTVLFSVILDTTVGDFNYNWIGLVDSASGTLCMIVHTATQKKIATSADGQGNTLTRTLAMQYDGAAAVSQITVTPATWQIDFSARLIGMDENVRLCNLDRYGHAAFIDDGFLITGAPGAFSASAGVGYVGGLRGELPANTAVSVPELPAVIWADLSWQGQVTSRWETVNTVTPGVDLVDYTDDNHFPHYVTAIASIDAAGVITDLRPQGTLDNQAGANDYMRKDQNLDDVEDKEVARSNLDVYGKEEGDEKYLIKSNGGVITGQTGFNFQGYIEKSGVNVSGNVRYAYGIRINGSNNFKVEFYQHELTGQYTQAVINVIGATSGSSYAFSFRENGYIYAKRFIPDEWDNIDSRYDDRFNQRYLTGTQLGARQTVEHISDLWATPSGCVLTGLSGDSDNDIATQYAPIQILRNGVWATISG